MSITLEFFRMSEKLPEDGRTIYYLDTCSSFDFQSLLAQESEVIYLTQGIDDCEEGEEPVTAIGLDGYEIDLPIQKDKTDFFWAYADDINFSFDKDSFPSDYNILLKNGDASFIENERHVVYLDKNEKPTKEKTNLKITYIYGIFSWKGQTYDATFTEQNGELNILRVK